MIPNNETILVVGHNPALRFLVSDSLQRSLGDRCQIQFAATRDEALTAVRELEPALVILDLLLLTKHGEEDPGEGLLLCRELKALTDLPILICSSLVRSALVGLSLGADDFVASPFDPDELAARIARLLARSGPKSAGVCSRGSNRVRIGNLVLDRMRRRATVGDRDLDLTNTQFALLSYLMSHPDAVIPRDVLGHLLRDGQGGAPDGALSVHMVRLRRKLGEGDGAVPRIVGLRNAGYKLVSPRKPGITESAEIQLVGVSSAPTAANGHRR